MIAESWLVLNEETLFENPWVQVRQQRVRLPEGTEYDYTIVDRPKQGVGVLLFDGEGRLLLEREYRHAIGQVVWQIPGGLLDDTHSPLENMQRELREETGYEAAEWEELDEFYDNPALGNASSRLFLAHRPQQTANLHWDEAESVECHWVTLEWLREAIQRGEIIDRVVLAGVAMLWARGII
jgi:ADP-ribose pyrophosphatase